MSAKERHLDIVETNALGALIDLGSAALRELAHVIYLHQMDRGGVPEPLNHQLKRLTELDRKNLEELAKSVLALERARAEQ